MALSMEAFTDTLPIVCNGFTLQISGFNIWSCNQTFGSIKRFLHWYNFSMGRPTVSLQWAHNRLNHTEVYTAYGTTYLNPNSLSIVTEQ